MQPALFLAGHGSRDPEGTREFLQLVELLRAQAPDRIIECGFLEFARPVIGEGIERCVTRGAQTIVVLPGMLMAAGHAKNDIPSEIHEARRRYPGVRFHYGRHLHLHAKLIELCKTRLEESDQRSLGRAEQASRPDIGRQDTVLLVVGRGSSDPDANSDISKLARILAEGMGYGWSAACFIGVTTPLLAEALDRCRRLGFARVLVFPFFLFTGVLEKRIRQQTLEFAARHPETDFRCAGYLNAHSLLYEAFLERADEAVHGSPNMNCELCKYRVRLPGFEQALGQPQVGHHHHVRGIGQDDHNQDDHDHHHDHGHGHAHEHGHAHQHRH
jgi:sirohydrochlorin cobaltochelatase